MSFQLFHATVTDPSTDSGYAERYLTELAVAGMWLTEYLQAHPKARHPRTEPVVVPTDSAISLAAWLNENVT